VEPDRFDHHCSGAVGPDDRLLYCPCGLSHAHIWTPPYVSLDAALAFITEKGVGPAPCHSCGGELRPVPASGEKVG
jgi:hypothetical protein